MSAHLTDGDKPPTSIQEKAGRYSERRFINEVGNEILVSVSLGDPGCMCRIGILGPDSGIESYVTRMELEQLQEALAVALGPRRRPAVPGEAERDIYRSALAAISRASNDEYARGKAERALLDGATLGEGVPALAAVETQHIEGCTHSRLQIRGITVAEQIGPAGAAHFEALAEQINSRAEQQLNKRTNHRVEWRGLSLTLSEWGAKLKVHPNTIVHRLRRGWPTERALSTGADQTVLLELANRDG